MRILNLSTAVILAALTLTVAPLRAFEIENEQRFGAQNASDVIQVISTADIAVFAPVIASFLETRNEVALNYVVVSSAELMKALSVEGAKFDLAISSAMDLQTKLANDGGARPHRSDATADLPDWARWRDELFAFTQEPAAIVLSKAAFKDLPLPTTRQELITILRQNPDRFRGRIGTYDLRQSGLGYLFATQDARTSETYWRLTEVMGGLDTKLYCCSSHMIDAVATGELALAYNVLGSYAQARKDADSFEILLPADFTTIMLRTALIPATSEEPDLAGDFLDHLLSIAWADTPPPSYPFAGLNQQNDVGENGFRRIRMGPGLMVYLDQFKKRSFLKAWENAILQP
ncbi:MAG: ABC transporter substrate-binding protein [Paracoccaceae bacterium]